MIKLHFKSTVTIEGNLLSSPSITEKWETYLRSVMEKGHKKPFWVIEVPEQLKAERISRSIETVQHAESIARCLQTFILWMFRICKWNNLDLNLRKKSFTKSK